MGGPLQVEPIGPADIWAVTSGSDAKLVYQVTQFPPGTPGFEAGAWRCNCMAGQFGRGCRHINAVQTRLAGAFRPEPAKHSRRYLTSVQGDSA